MHRASIIPSETSPAGPRLQSQAIRVRAPPISSGGIEISSANPDGVPHLNPACPEFCPGRLAVTYET